MSLLSRFMRGVALTMALVMLATSLPINLARAAMVSTDQVVEQSALAAERTRVMEFMAREDVHEQLRALGIEPDEAMQRTASLSDAEVQEIAGHLNQLPAGEGAIGIVLGVLLFILIVLIITDLLGLTNAFTFIKPVS